MRAVPRQEVRDAIDGCDGDMEGVGMRPDGDDTSLKQLSREVDDLVVQRQYWYPGKEGHAPSRRVRVPARGLVKYGL